MTSSFEQKTVMRMNSEISHSTPPLDVFVAGSSDQSPLVSHPCGRVFESVQGHRDGDSGVLTQYHFGC